MSRGAGRDSSGEFMEVLEAELPSCLVCNDIITNPVCYKCLEKEVCAWLSDSKPKLMSGLKEYSGMFSSYSHSGTRCILCRKNVNICAHCYCHEVHKMLAEHPDLSREFLHLFNFELVG